MIEKKGVYGFLKQLPLLGTILDKIRLKVHAMIVRVVDEKLPQIQTQLNAQLQTGLEHGMSRVEALNHVHEQQVNQQYKHLSDRIEFVRLELFYELMNKSASLQSTNEESMQSATILNTSAYEQAIANHKIHINLGCGHKAVEGYLNIDQRALPHVDVQADIMHLPFEVNTVDEIYAAHLVEHFTMQSLRSRVLPYWLNLLKPHGVVRLIAPNAQAMIESYANQGMPFEQLTTVLLGMQEYEGDFHYAMLSPENLTKLLQEVGFTAVEVITSDRPNGLCFEMELIAKKPMPS